jgi:dihydroxyacetone kinase
MRKTDMTHENLKDAALEAAHSAKDAGREALDAAKSSVAETAQAARAAIRDEAETRADAGKDMIADEGRRLAQGLRAAAGNKGSDSLHGRLLETFATSVSDMSEGLRSRSFGSLLSEAEGFARRNPGAFVAAAGLTGFALARFAAASTPDPVSSQGKGSDSRPARPSAATSRSAGPRS